MELINIFNKVARYKIDIQKSAVSLYTKNEISEKENPIHSIKNDKIID